MPSFAMRQGMVEAMRRMLDLGLSQGTSGNLSVRSGAGFLVTPSGIPAEQLSPDDLVLIPGCLDSTTNFVEHPQLVAQRLANYTAAVGPDRVMAGTDCGFSTFAGFGVVDPDIVWAKFASLAEGAAIASR